MKTFASLVAVLFLALGAAARAGGGSATVAKVGSQMITTKQVGAVLAYDRAYYRKQGWTFPRRGAAEYLLLREQAIDFLVEQSRAHQADARIGIAPHSRIVTDAAWRKVTAKVHAADPVLLKKRRATSMRGFVAAAHRDYPVAYARGYKPVAEWKLAKRAWTVRVVSKVCDLSPGMYPLVQAIAHSCVPASENGPWVGPGEKPCALVDQPGGVDGFTSAEENDGFADYITSNAGSCAGGPRGTTVPITAEDNTTPVTVSYLRRSGTATLSDERFGISLRYPRRLHTLRLRSEGFQSGSAGIEISNFKLQAPSLGRKLPRGGIDVGILVDFADHPTFPLARDASFPLGLAGDRALRGMSTRVPLQADGEGYTIVIREGSKPSAEDQAAVREIVTSIRFQAARRGTFLASGFYVLGRATNYEPGSVTRIRGGVRLPYPPNRGRVQRSRPFYLVHGKSGFLELAWRKGSACNVHFDAAHRIFRCEDGSAWNLRGEAVAQPRIAGKSDDQPWVSPAPVSFDGYVLVNID